MSTLATAITFARAQAQTDINGLPDATAILYANEALVDFHRRLVDNEVDASQLQEAYTASVSGTGTYLYPTDMLALKTIELNYTDSSAQNYILANQVDVSNIPGGNSFSNLRLNQSTQAPLFDDRGDWFEIFPTPAVSNSQMIRIFYFLKPAEYVATSDTISYPESQDYRILGWRMAADYYYSLGKFQEGDMFNTKYEERVTQYISTLGRGSSQPIQATPISWTGWEF